MNIRVTMCALALCAAPARAEQGTMCGKFNTSASGCAAPKGMEASEYDQPVYVTATQATPLNKLVVFFHGHGGAPAGNNDFLALAAQKGYDTIDLDYDYGRDYKSPPWPCKHAEVKGGVATCVLGGRDVCGCYTDCYGYRWESIWRGTAHTGVPPVGADWTVDARLKAVLKYMSGKVTRFGQYLDPAQLDGINWAGKGGVAGITLAAHSLGDGLIGHIAKWQQVDRVIFNSGVCDKLAPDLNASWKSNHNVTPTWENGYGCNSCVGTDENGNPYTFSGCTCNRTSFEYGAANGIGACTLSTKAVGWIQDNAFGAVPAGAHWKTDISRMYAFADSSDTTCTWEAPKAIATQRNWIALNFAKQHAAGAADGWNYVGDCAHPLGPQAGKNHALLSTTIPGKTYSQICNQASLICTAPGGTSGHNATVSGDACTGNTAAGNARNAIWEFMLTNP
jgi:hypothetical protein